MNRFSVLILAAVALPVASARIAGAERRQAYADPFAYCAAVGTIDAPDARFSGRPPTAEAAAAFGVQPELVTGRGLAWRCDRGAVLACVQLNTPICGKADMSETPSAAMVDFCRADPDNPVIPLVVIGHEHPPAYDWGCREGHPAIGRQLFTPDPRGYPPQLWKTLRRR